MNPNPRLRLSLALSAGLLAGSAGSALAEPVPVDLGTSLLSDVSPGYQFLEIDFSGEGEGDIQFAMFELAPDLILAELSRANQGLDVSDGLDFDFPNINDPSGDPPANVVRPIPEGQWVWDAVEDYVEPGGFAEAFNALYIDFPAYGVAKPVYNGGIVLNQDFYVGVKFRETREANAPVHYGWAKVRLDWAGRGGTNSWTVLAAAYESEPNGDIIAGDSGTAPCLADTNGDGILDNGDIGVFVQDFLAGDLAADFNGDGVLDNGDIGTFVALFLAGC